MTRLVEVNAELVKAMMPPRSIVNGPEIWSDTLVVRSTKARVLVEPEGAERVRLWTLKLPPEVAASMVTVLVLALVIRIKLKLEFGAWLLDQFSAFDQRPPALFVQRSVVAAEDLPAMARRADRQKSAMRRNRL